MRVSVNVTSWSLPVSLGIEQAVVTLHWRGVCVCAGSYVRVDSLACVCLLVVRPGHDPRLIFPASSVAPSELTPVNSVPAAVENPFACVITATKIAPRKNRVRTRQKLFILFSAILEVLTSE